MTLFWSGKKKKKTAKFTTLATKTATTSSVNHLKEKKHSENVHINNVGARVNERSNETKERKERVRKILVQHKKIPQNFTFCL